MFDSKKEFAQALMDGRRFEVMDAIMYYDENSKENESPFRVKDKNTNKEYEMSSYWHCYNVTHLKEIKEWYEEIPKDGIWCWVWNDTKAAKYIVNIIEYDGNAYYYKYKNTANEWFTNAEPVNTNFIKGVIDDNE